MDFKVNNELEESLKKEIENIIVRYCNLNMTDYNKVTVHATVYDTLVFIYCSHLQFMEKSINYNAVDENNEMSLSDYFFQKILEKIERSKININIDKNKFVSNIDDRPENFYNEFKSGVRSLNNVITNIIDKLLDKHKSENILITFTTVLIALENFILGTSVKCANEGYFYYRQGYKHYDNLKSFLISDLLCSYQKIKESYNKYDNKKKE